MGTLINLLPNLGSAVIHEPLPDQISEPIAEIKLRQLPIRSEADGGRQLPVLLTAFIARSAYYCAPLFLPTELLWGA
jgi:hypothetical protein